MKSLKNQNIGIIFILSVLLIACKDNKNNGVSTEGHHIFKKVANQELEYALSGTIEKEPGFSSNCSVAKDSEGGILITRGVCDDDISFSIRVTNTSGYPPSKRLKNLSLYSSGREIELLPGEIKEIIDSYDHKISLELSKTGSSFFIEGTRALFTSP